MNTNRTGMRTVLVAAAAGALIMGSAAGTMAAPSAKADKSTVKLQSVSIHGHRALNVFSAETAAARPIQVRATVWYAPKAPEAATPLVSVGLAAFTKKVKGDPIALTGFPLVDSDVALRPSNSKKATYFKDAFTLNADQAKVLKDYLEAPTTTGKTYLCIASASIENYVEKTSTQVKKRLGEKGKPVRDCVKVVNVDPTAPN